MNAHRFAHISAVLSFLLLFPLYFCETLIAQDAYHVFTDKKGQAIEAALLLVTPDKTTLEIRRKDGREFEIPILTLSLDDQQFIKERLKKNPIKMDYNLELTFKDNIEDSNTVPVLFYDCKFVTEETNFKIKIKNLTRAKLTGVTLEYYIITEHEVITHPYTNPKVDPKDLIKDWFNPFDLVMKGEKKPTEKPISLSHGEVQVEDLPYLFSTDIMTGSVPVRKITTMGNRSMYKDKILGVIVRFMDDNGNQFGVEQRSSKHKFLKRSWEEIAQLPPGDPTRASLRDNRPRNN